MLNCLGRILLHINCSRIGLLIYCSASLSALTIGFYQDLRVLLHKMLMSKVLLEYYFWISLVT